MNFQTEAVCFFHLRPPRVGACTTCFLILLKLGFLGSEHCALINSKCLACWKLLFLCGFVNENCLFDTSRAVTIFCFRQLFTNLLTKSKYEDFFLS